MQDHTEVGRRHQFLKLATWFEGGLLAFAFVLGWMLSVDPLAHWKVDVSAVAWGLVGTAPLYALFLVGYRAPQAGMRVIRDFLTEKLGPYLSACRIYELFYLGLLAGVAEELLFRGVLQPWFEDDWGRFAGLLISNLIFALVHWVTPLYGLLAGLTGVYLGLSLDATGERNVLIPTLIHGLYDFLAFVVVARSWSQRPESDSSTHWLP
jgi:membrane protease YdiL (CAAX protease family)